MNWNNDNNSHNGNSSHHHPTATFIKTLFGSCIGQVNHTCNTDCTIPSTTGENRSSSNAMEFRREQVLNPRNLVGSFVSVQKSNGATNNNTSFLSHPEDLTMSTAQMTALDDSGITFDSSSLSSQREQHSNARLVSPENYNYTGRVRSSESERRAARQIFVSRYRKFQHGSSSNQNQGSGHSHTIEQCGTMNTLGTIYSSEFDSAWKHSPTLNSHVDEYELTMQAIGADDVGSPEHYDRSFPQYSDRGYSFPRVVSTGDRSLSSANLQGLPLHTHVRSLSSKREDLLLIEEDCPEDEIGLGEI